MSIRTKVLMVFAPFVAILIAVLFGALSYQMMSGFERTEHEYVTEHVLRVEDTLRGYSAELCRPDWWAWDDTYKFVQDLNQDYVDTNLTPTSYAPIGIDTLVFLSETGELRFARSFDMASGNEVPVDPALLNELKPGSPFLLFEDHFACNTGILAGERSLFFVAAHAILNSNFEGPPRGTLVLCKRLDAQLAQDIGKQLRVAIDIQPLPLEQRTEPDQAGTPVRVAVMGPDVISGSGTLKDIHGRDVVQVTVELPRRVHAQAVDVRQSFLYIVVIIGLVSGISLLVAIELIVVSRVRRLSREVTRIEGSGEREARISESGNDELSSLARNINGLTQALKKAANSQVEQDARYRLLTTSAPVGILETKAGGECIFANPRWCELSGRTVQTSLGFGWLEAIHPDDRESLEQLWSETGGGLTELECRLVRENKSTVWIAISTVTLRDNASTLPAHISCVTDITARKRVELEMRDSEERYRDILEAQVELVCRYRMDTTLVYVNDAYCAYFGKRREELIGTSFLDSDANSKSGLNREQIIESRRNLRGPVTTRLRVSGASGEVRWLEWEDTPIRNNRGEIIEFQAIGRDITERKVAEDALRDSEAKLRSITASVAEAIIMMNSEGVVSFWNDAAERIFGYRSEEIIGKLLHDYIVPERYRAAFNAGHVSFSETGQGAVIGRSHELQGLRKDGTEFPLELFVAAVKFDGKWHAIGTGRDITDRKRTEEQLAANAREMEAANMQLEEAIAQANQLALEAQVASVAKSDFVANMSHEIRTPLNGVIGMTTLLLDTDLTQEQREFSEMVKTSGEALLSVVNDILDFSKIEAGKLELESIPFDLRVGIEQIGDILAPRAQEKGLEFTILVHHDVPEYVKGDPGRLRQILINLCGNALKFTERGEIVVSAQLASSSDGGATVLFEVTDSGIGIPENRMHSLFQPFTQADSSTTRKYGGTGLGLTISKRLCEAMGGQITVRSKIGKGSTFAFTASFAILPAPEIPAAPNRESLAGLRMLTVDTSAIGRKVYREMLRNWGVSVDEAPDTTAAYEMMRAAAAAAQPFSVVLVDHFQPTLEVGAFAEKVGSDPVLSSTQLLLVTSWPKRGDAAEMSKHGFRAYLTKPVKRTHLLDAIAAVMSRDTASKHDAKIVTQHSLNESARRSNKILLVEDNVINQKVAIRLLERVGYRCDLANNGREAVEAATRTRYDIILMDCQMPEMDGYEATKAIRRHEGENHYTPIIALTASTLRVDHDQCLNAGMDMVLTKPVHAEALEETLRQYLSDNPPIRRKRVEKPAVAKLNTPVDMDRLSEITMGDVELETELIVTFLADTTERLMELGGCIQSQDSNAMGRIAHALKGSAGNMGANGLQDIAKRLEDFGKTGAFSEIQPTFEQLRAEAERVKEYLSGYMNA